MKRRRLVEDENARLKAANLRLAEVVVRQEKRIAQLTAERNAANTRAAKAEARALTHPAVTPDGVSAPAPTVEPAPAPEASTAFQSAEGAAGAELGRPVESGAVAAPDSGATTEREEAK